MDFKIFDTLLEPIFIINNDKQIIYCNEPAGLICDLTVRKIIRNKLVFDETFQFSEPILALKNVSEIKDASPYQEVAFTNSEGRTGKIQITLQPFQESDNISEKSWIIFFRDVTLEETLQKKYRAELEQKEDVIRDLQVAQAELEKYSKNLEKMVEERTAEIQKLNKLMTALLNSLEQGFFVFNKEGLCLEVASSACMKVIEADPRGKNIWEIFNLPEKQVLGFQKWLKTLFAEMLPFEDLAPLGPAKYLHSQGREVKMEYFPIRDNDSQMTGVVAVATDITDLIRAQKEAETEKAHAKMILQLVQNRRQVQSFIQETQILIDDLLTQTRQEPLQYDSVFRSLHTIKGGAATFSIKETADIAHSAETLLTEWQFDPTPEKTKLLQEKADSIKNSFVAFQENNKEILGNSERMKHRWVEIPVPRLKEFWTRLSSQMKDSFAEEFLYEEIGIFFQQYIEVCKSVAERENKEISPLIFENSQLKIYPEFYNQLFNTLIHAYRNAVDHGLESPDRRLELGKPPAGVITTRFSLQKINSADFLSIEIQDDGAGIDPAKIRSRLNEKGIDTSSENDVDVIQHVFDSSFSTKSEVSETSGRGVGMDAILSVAKKLGGQARVTSVVNKGTLLLVQVPFLKMEDSEILKNVA